MCAMRAWDEVRLWRRRDTMVRFQCHLRLMIRSCWDRGVPWETEFPHSSGQSYHFIADFNNKTTFYTRLTLTHCSQQNTNFWNQATALRRTCPATLTLSPRATSNAETQLAYVFNGGSYCLPSLHVLSVEIQFNEITTVMASSSQAIYGVFVAIKFHNSYSNAVWCS